MATEITTIGPSFVDTNVWLYALIRAQNAEKSEKARRIVESMSAIIISTQVIKEVCVNLLKSLRFSETDICDVIAAFYDMYQVLEFNETVFRAASAFRLKYQFSFWDSVIAASAFVGGASVLYTEDMHDGLVIEQRLKIENPFK